MFASRAFTVYSRRSDELVEAVASMCRKAQPERGPADGVKPPPLKLASTPRLGEKPSPSLKGRC